MECFWVDFSRWTNQRINESIKEIWQCFTRACYGKWRRASRALHTQIPLIFSRENVITNQDNFLLIAIENMAKHSNGGRAGGRGNHGNRGHRAMPLSDWAGCYGIHWHAPEISPGFFSFLFSFPTLQDAFRCSIRCSIRCWISGGGGVATNRRRIVSPFLCEFRRRWRFRNNRNHQQIMAGWMAYQNRIEPDWSA